MTTAHRRRTPRPVTDRRTYAPRTSWPLVQTVATLNAAGFDAGEVETDAVRATARRYDGLLTPYQILERRTNDTSLFVGVLCDVFSPKPRVIDPVLIYGDGIAGAFPEADLNDVLAQAGTPTAPRNEHATIARFLLRRLPVAKPAPLLPPWHGSIDDELGLVECWLALANRPPLHRSPRKAQR